MGIFIVYLIVAVDSTNVYVTGFVSGSLDGQTFTGTSGTDIVLVKYDTSGNWLWTRVRGTAGNDMGGGGKNCLNRRCRLEGN